MVPASEGALNYDNAAGQNGHGAGQVHMPNLGAAAAAATATTTTSKGVIANSCMLAPPVMLQRISWMIRAYIILFTFVATVLMGAAKEGNIKSTSYSSLVYFVSANAIASAYSIVSLILNITGIVGTMNLEIPIFIKDVVVMAFLLTSNGAASTISKQLDDKYGYRYNTCSVLKKFCAEIKASIVLSMFAATGYLVLICLTFIHNKKK